MMTTRRKSKAAAAAASHTESESVHGDAPTLSLTLPSDIDIGTLSSLLPGDSLESPTRETILHVYRALLNQALQVDTTSRELEELRAEIEKKDVEIDQAYQDRENDKQEMESSVENVAKELKAVKSERDELAAAKANLQTELSSLSTSSNASSTELDALKLRVEDIEREKRDLIGVVSRLKEDCAQRDDEIKTLRNNLKQSRHDYQELESQVRELRSADISSKFKLDSLTQQLTLAKEESERAVSELNSKSEEFSKYRRSKHAEHAQLQASHDALSQTFSTIESTLKALQSSHTSQTQQLTQALTRVQDFAGQLAEQEATYSSEAAGLRRLIGMMEERETHTKNIVDSIEREWAAVGEKADRREVELKEDIDREARRADEAEKRVDELEKLLERLDRGEFPLPSSASAGFRTPGTGGNMPSTPTRNANGSFEFLSPGIFGLSPTVAMASRSQKSGKTFTEVYSEYVKLQEDYAKKSAECDHMDRTLQAVLAQLEERAPILSEQRSEYERLRTEASQLASQLASALSERDVYGNQAQETSQKLKNTVRENDLLESQLEDLGRQVQTLLRELGRNQDPSIPSEEELEADPNTAPPQNIDEVITNNLVLFRSIPGLQEQNQKLLKIVRDLGAKLETEEREYREALQLEQTEAVMEAHNALQKMQEDLDNQKKSSELTIQTYMKERDALKSLLSRAEQRASGMAAVASMNRTDVGAGPESDSELAKELAEVQSQFESYRTEMGFDCVKLREELALAQREVGQLGAALAKANAKIEYLNDRHRMAQEQFTITNREVDNLTKRNQHLYDQYTRIDIECNRVTEDLLTSNGRLEQLRNECANLRAEKKIWEDVQTRLVDENKTLAIERSHLSDLMSNVQKMHNDLERSGENDRRRLESQIQMLESQTQDLRAQLSRERDSVRHISLQKEIETKELQSRIDKSAEDLSKTRESLVEAETSRRHLDERVQELTRQLHGNEEKLSVYERRPSGANGVGQRLPDDTLNREQQLEAEVAELRGALKVAEVDLANARSHVQQFQEISQANEEALSSLNATYDEYKSSTEAQIAKYQSDYSATQDRLQTVQAELTKLEETHTSSHQTFEKERKSWTEDKKLLEDTIADMTASGQSVENDRASQENELRKRAETAEDSYSREVLAHAEAIKTTEELRARLNSARTAALDAKTAAKTANEKLATSESSWKHQKDTLDKELADLNKRCKDLVSQNTLLHSHLESVSSQAAKIRDAASSSASTAVEADEDSAEDPDTKLSELRSVVAWLRKEKDIVELQLELSKQETVRLKTQVDHLSLNLDQTRATLSEERERADEAATSQAEHEILMSKINELTVFRESNATLRADCEAKTKRISEMETKLQQVSAEVGPAKQELLVAKAELEARDSQVGRLQEENRRWQERNSQLMTKYDRIDPTELQGLKDELERLRSQNSQQEKDAVDKYKKQVESLESKLREVREFSAQTQQRVRQQMAGFNKDKSELSATVAELRTQLQKVTAERDSLKGQAGTVAESQDSRGLTEQLEVLKNEKTALETALAEAKSQTSSEKPDQTALIASLQQERDSLLVEKSTWVKSSAESTANTSVDEARTQLEEEKAKLITDRDAALAQAKDINVQMTKMKENLRTQYRQNQTNQQKITALENEKKDATAKQQEAINVAVTKARSEIQTPDSSVTNEQMVKRHAEELEALEARLKAAHKNEIDAAVTAARQAASASTSASAEAQKAAIEAAVTAAKSEWAKGQEEALEQAVERGRMEQATKTRIKDSQLLKSQTRVKDLEAQLLKLQSSSGAPEPAASATASTSQAPPVAAAAQAKLPGRPAGVGPATRGRGAARTLSAALGGRGGAPAPAAAPAQPASGVSIMGAAKRPREEGEVEAPPPENSLAKRLKPAEAKPVPIRRPGAPKPQ